MPASHSLADYRTTTCDLSMRKRCKGSGGFAGTKDVATAAWSLRRACVRIAIRVVAVEWWGLAVLYSLHRGS
jgi:hypothetical protein